MEQGMDGDIEYYPPGAGIDLSNIEVEHIKGWLARGDTFIDIANRTGLKPNVVAEIKFGQRFAWVRPAETWELPDAIICRKKAIRDALKRMNEIARTVTILNDYEDK